MKKIVLKVLKKEEFVSYRMLREFRLGRIVRVSVRQSIGVDYEPNS